MRLRSLFLSAGLLLLPLPALALQQVEWNFLNSNLPGKWEVHSLDAPEALEGGLRIHATTDGYMVRDTDDLQFPIDAITVRVTANRPMDAALLWKSSKDELLYQKQFSIMGVGASESIDVSLSDEYGWDPSISVIGIALPAGADITLQSMTAKHWNPYEKAFEVMRSFWHLDSQFPYSINFLWGPLIATNPIATDTIFETLPPHGHSGMWLLLGALAIGGVSAFIWKRFGTGGVRLRSGFTGAAILMMTIAAACWFIADMRMSVELLSYMKDDLQNFVQKNPEQRNFRNYENIYDMTMLTVKHLDPRENFVLVSDFTQIGGALRYYGYPHRALTPDTAPAGTRSWLVFRKQGAAVDDLGNLTVGGKILAGPGTVTKQFFDGSFLFQVSR